MVRPVFAWTLALGLSFVLFAGCVGGEEQSDPTQSQGSPRRVAPARDPASAEFKPHVVVAVIDTGVNPYHEEFREMYDWDDPANYIPGYPEDVITLKLSEFKAPVGPGAGANREAADKSLWEDTKPNQLYRIEGTKIVGLITLSGNLPGAGHGTMTASRATGNTISVGGPSIRLVMVQGFNAQTITWASQQPWIDILSISAGISGANPVVGNVQDSAGMKAQDAASHLKPFFASSGNGLGNAGAFGFPTWLRGASGVPDVISVGANDNGKMAVWHNWQPYIVGDGCQNPSATDNSVDRITNTGGGTSSATPFSAGTGAALLLEARRILRDPHVGTRMSDTPLPSQAGPWKSLYEGDNKIILAQGDANLVAKGPLSDGYFTLQEFKDVLYHTALWDGSNDKSDGNECTGPAMGIYSPSQMPRDAVVQMQGYGEVNAKSLESAIKVIAGEMDNPSRSSDDAWYQRFHDARVATMPRT